MSLDQIKSELLECYKNHQPVLLYGEGYISLGGLIRDVHVANGGIDAEVEYFDDKGNIISKQDHDNERGEALKGKVNGELYKAWNEFDKQYPSRSTTRTWEYVDCGALTAKEVYIELVIEANISCLAEIDEESKMLLDKYMSIDIGRISEDELRSLQGNDSLIDITAFSDAKELQDVLNGKIKEVEPVYKGYLRQCKGGLFIDNLQCDPSNREDMKYYNRLAKIIKDGALEGWPANYNWLVCYTYNPEDFPKYFRDQFVEIAIAEPSEATIESEERQEEKVEKTLPKGKYVFREEDDFYFIRYEHESFRLRATNGLRYIHFLLKHPYAENTVRNKFIPKHLYEEINEAYKIYDLDEDAIASLRNTCGEAVGADVRSGFDFKFRGDYTEGIVDLETKEKIVELENKRDIAESTGNEEAASDAQIEIDVLRNEYVKKYLRRGGRVLKFPSALHKKPYDSIYQAMNIAYKRIKKCSEAKGYESMLTLKHLKNSIQFEYSCFFYNPEKPPDWQF